MKALTRIAFSNRHRRYLLIQQSMVPAAFHLVLNGFIAWVLTRSLAVVPIWGEASVSADLLATAFLLPFLTSIISSPLVVRDVRIGTISPLPAAPSSGFLRSSSARGLLLGVAGVLFGAVPIVSALGLAGADAFPVSSFVAFKAVWAGMLALIVSPIAAWWTLK